MCFCLPFCIRSGKLYVFINSYHTLVHLKFVSRESVMCCYRLDCGWPDEDIWHKWMKSFYLVIDHFKNKRRPRTHQKAYHENLEIRLSPGTGIGQSGALKRNKSSWCPNLNYFRCVARWDVSGATYVKLLLLPVPTAGFTWVYREASRFAYGHSSFSDSPLFVCLAHAPTHLAPPFLILSPSAP